MDFVDTAMNAFLYPNEMRRLVSNDDVSSETEARTLLNTLYVNIFIFVCLMLVFEYFRHNKHVYLKRYSNKFIRSKRVPSIPPSHMFGWLYAISDVSDDDFLRMVGLDAYIFLRFIKLCLKGSAFFCLWGIVVLAPVYMHAGGGSSYWNTFTLANIPNTTESANILYVPIVFAYLFSGYFCYLLQGEYKNFVDKRLLYLIEGDPDTPVQANYTVMVERVPKNLQSVPMIRDFFDKLFPGQVYSAEILFDLSDLDVVVKERFEIRNKLEKYIALWKATDKRPMEYISQEDLDDVNAHLSSQNSRLRAHGKSNAVHDNEEFEGDIEHHSTVYPSNQVNSPLFQQEAPNSSVITEYKSSIDAGDHDRMDTPLENKTDRRDQHKTALIPDEYVLRSEGVYTSACGLENCTDKLLLVDSITYYSLLLRNFNHEIKTMQETYVLRREKLEAVGRKMLRGKLKLHADAIAAFLTSKVASAMDSVPFDSVLKSTTKAEDSSAMDEMSHIENDSFAESAVNNSIVNENTNCNSSTCSANINSDEMRQRNTSHHTSTDSTNIVKNMFGAGIKVASKGIGGVLGLVGTSAEIASKGAVKGLLEATRALELLTVGAYYRTSSTAFVTFKNRVSTCSAYQMLLSHEYFNMRIHTAPNPKDVVWDNVSIPETQRVLRTTIADTTIIVGAIFWSIVVGFIAAISNLDSLSEEYSWLNDYKNTWMYDFLNQYLAVAILLILLTILPAIFDVIARSYEGMKLESEIQNSIMTRYFYYQVANVYVAVGLGSIASSLHAIIDSPQNILSILGASLPSVSTYFVSLVIVKVFTAIPLEMLRFMPLLDILRVTTCADKKKCTRRELRSGAFIDPPMLYGWCYPNIMMVLMIMVTYSVIAPFLMPFCFVFFLFAYLMYKYQLLYVYINESQAGGYMWYAVFDRFMVSLILATLTLLGYYLIRMTYDKGPLYLLIPLPFLLIYFWRRTDTTYKKTAMQLSLESAMDLEQISAMRKEMGKAVPNDFFVPNMYMQPSLAHTDPVTPAPYRKVTNRQLHGVSNQSASTLSSIAADLVSLAEASDSRTMPMAVDVNLTPDPKHTSAKNVTIRHSSNDANIGLFHARQSLIGGGMYTYDADSDDEEEQVEDLLTNEDAQISNTKESQPSAPHAISNSCCASSDIEDVLSPTAFRISSRNDFTNNNNNSPTVNNYGSMDHTKL